MKVIKRDGSEVTFDKNKIINAVTKANNELELIDDMHTLSVAQIKSIATVVEKECEKLGRAVEIDTIQELVEKAIMEHRGYEVAQLYIRYRYKKDLKRKSNTTDGAILSLVDLKNEEVKQENSNKNPIINSVQRDYIAGEVSKDISSRIILDEDIVQAHRDGLIHFHDMDYFLTKMHNCFSGGTKFVTDKGTKRFKDFQDGEEVYVKTYDGEIRPATVHRYGVQQMQKVTLRNSKMTTDIVCTPNHRWKLKSGEITTSLKVGDVLYPCVNSTDYEIKSKSDAEAFCIGFAIGDGVDLKTDAVRVRLCGDKIKYSDIFKRAGYSIKPINNSKDLVAYRGSALKQDFLNGKAWRFMPVEQKALVFKGYYAADGATKANRISTSDERVCELIEDLSGIAGYYISSKVEEVRNTNYKENAVLFTYHFIVSTPENWCWKVTNIEKRKESYAWCVEEPITHTFMLEKGIVTGNCCLVNMEDMLQNGTVISGRMIEKPKSFLVACNVATQIIAQVASSQYGGQTVSLAHISPFIEVSRQKLIKRYENGPIVERLREKGLSEEEIKAIVDEEIEDALKSQIKQGVQTIQYQIETLMTTNGQTPFVTLFMCLSEAKTDADRKDLAMMIEELLKQRIQGIKNEKGVYVTPAFPKLIYVLDEYTNRGGEYEYLTKIAAECTAKRMVPDYISAKKMRELKDGDIYPCMGCRSFLTVDRCTTDRCTTVKGNIANAKNYVEGQRKYYGRFNQGVVTINLVDVACSSVKDMDKFWKILDDRLELCHRALRARHDRLKGTPSDVAPILWQHGALARLEKGETIDKLLYDGYSTISLGYAGLYEMCVYMTGKSHTDEEGKPFALAVMQRLNDKCAEWKAAENIDYSVYGTPLESTTYKFAKCLQNRFGIVDGVTDHSYITNSYHVNVREEIDAFSKLKFESEFQALSPGGAISYVEVPNLTHNLEAVRAVMDCISDNIMYAELNTKSDYCMVCNYDGEIKIVEEDGKLLWECPKCGNRDQLKMSVARRTCGYIGTQFWNQGRTQEIRDRVMHL